MVQQLVKETLRQGADQGASTPTRSSPSAPPSRAASRTGDVKDILVLDVTPLSLGVETLGGVMTVLIPRNTTIPTEKKETFSTAADNQTAVTINVLQGEREFAEDNRLLGSSTSKASRRPRAACAADRGDVRHRRQRHPHVAAKDKATGKEARSPSRTPAACAKDEIEKMKRDAEAHAAEDKKRRESRRPEEPGREPRLPDREDAEEHGEKVSADDPRRDRRAPQRPPRRAQERRRRPIKKTSRT